MKYNRKLTLSEKLQEEIKYSNMLDSKIKKLEDTHRHKKEKSGKINFFFEMKKENNNLKSKQNKLENEILLILNDFDEEIKNDLNREFYSMYSIEKTVQKDFRNNLNVVKNLLIDKTKTSVNSDLIKNVIIHLKNFNNDLLNIPQIDIDTLFDKSLCEFNSFDTNIMKADIFNILNNLDINYILIQESIMNDSLKKYINKKIDNSLTSIITFDKLSPTIDSDIVNKCEIILGVEEKEKIINSFNKASELAFLKNEIEYKSIYKDLNDKILSLSIKDVNDRARINNINYYYRVSEKIEKIEKRLTLEFPKENKNILLQYNSFVDHLYVFRNNKALILQNYKNELNELVFNFNNIIQECINNEIQNINKNIKDYEYIGIQEEMKIAHAKNKEIYEIKKKISEEKKEKESQLLKKELEKKEKLLKEHYDEIKNLSENYKTEKLLKINEEKLERDKEEREKLTLIKQQVKSKLPIVIKRQSFANDKFVNLYKQKEIIKHEKEIQKERLKNIVENLKVRPKIDIDPERVKQITENLKIRYETKTDEADKIKLFVNNGFTVDNLMKDLRYKISYALSEAGLLYKDYSNNLLCQLSLGLK